MTTISYELYKELKKIVDDYETQQLQHLYVDIRDVHTLKQNERDKLMSIPDLCGNRKTKLIDVKNLIDEHGVNYLYRFRGMGPKVVKRVLKHIYPNKIIV